jgi:hypothetical protein
LQFVRSSPGEVRHPRFITPENATDFSEAALCHIDRKHINSEAFEINAWHRRRLRYNVRAQAAAQEALQARFYLIPALVM